MVADAGDEPVEVVDADGRVLRVVPRRQMRAERLRHRTVFVAVVSTDGRLLVHLRSAAKDVWPGWWDVAVGGVVAAGEGWDEAAARELAEEVGVVGRCYRIVHDGPFSFADGEVVHARFVTPDELADLRRQERFLPDSVALLLPLLPGFGPHIR